MPKAIEILSRHGVSVDEARQWIMDNMNSPELIFSTARQFRLGNDMLAEIVGVNAGEVRGFFKGHGLRANLLDAPDYLGGLTMWEAFQWIIDHVNNPQEIYKVSREYKLNTSQLSEITGFSIDDIRSYFYAHDLKPILLDTADFDNLKKTIDPISVREGYWNGTEGDDFIQGSAGDDTINGLGGNDVIYGFAGDDKIDGGSGSDFIDGGGGNDTIYAGSEIILPQATVDVRETEAKKDYDYSSNVIYGGAGADKIYGGPGDDMIFGDDGDDYIEGDYYPSLPSVKITRSGNNYIDGGNGDDTIINGRGTDIIFGGDGNDTIKFSGAFGDYGSPFDEIDGGPGDDLIECTGSNKVFGGAGDDTIRYLGPFAASPDEYHQAVIKPGEGEDKISISRSSANAMVVIDLAEDVAAEDEVGLAYDIRHSSSAPAINIINFDIKHDEIKIGQFHTRAGTTSQAGAGYTEKVSSPSADGTHMIVREELVDYSQILTSASKEYSGNAGFFVIQAAAASKADSATAAAFLDAYGNNASYGSKYKHYFLVNVGNKDCVLYEFNDDGNGDDQIAASEIFPVLQLTGVRTENFKTLDIVDVFEGPV